MSARNLRRDPKNRCTVCGVRTTLHFTADNRKLTCQQAAEAHPRASARILGFVAALTLVAEGAR